MAGWDQQEEWDREDALEQKISWSWDQQNGSDLADRLTAFPLGKEISLGTNKWIIKKSFYHGPTSAAVKVVCNSQREDELLVCKAVRLLDGGGITRKVPEEVRILLDILPRNQRLCAILEYFPAPDNVFLMEFCDGGDLDRLSKFYRDKDELLPESFLWHVFLQGAEGLAYIHHGHGQTDIPKHNWSPIIHLDIKPENIFLQWRPGCDTTRDYPDLKIGDFGLSVVVNELRDEPPYVFHAGTHAWKPPEQPLVTMKTDVWSLGAVIHHLCHGREPIEVPPSNWRSNPTSKREIMPIARIYSRALQYWFYRALEIDRVKRIDSAVLADSLAGIVPVFLKRREPLLAGAAMGIMLQRSTSPGSYRPRWSRDGELLSEDDPSQGYADYLNDHPSLSFTPGDDAGVVDRRSSQEPEEDEPPQEDTGSWRPSETW
ncbi:hypothetical protein MMC11_001138 [Xylographa trunciseda]|nr:hypothetical protein [Xylographa trunciseda]